ncbi:hypothetical protein [Pseudomonas massiliensis]|uniref:hypothetical protein n=1 Tax=Pseudomonas massiliensis TaxID=522492 RepID=UPI0005910F91|nr:hypothetical protein [Pseudomonas massiliensis]
MASRSDQFVLKYSYGVHTLAVKANGGSVSVEKQVGTDWVVADTFAADGVHRLDLGNTPTRFTPRGGAAYEVAK